MKTLKLNKTFRINDNYSINCYYENTRHGFRHVAKLIGPNYTEVCKTKCCYYNRTWESFKYESVISELLNKAKIMTKEQKSEFMDLLQKCEYEKISKQFAFIGNFAKLAALTTNTPAEANEMQKRVLSASLPGLSFPEDWNSLSEDEKAKRLNNVANELTK